MITKKAKEEIQKLANQLDKYDKAVRAAKKEDKGVPNLMDTLRGLDKGAVPQRGQGGRG